MSNTWLRLVSSPPPSTSCFLAQSGQSASELAQNLVPSTAPWAPSISAAATPRPSVIPPAASTGTGATASATAGTSGKVARRLPCPPASVPWATITSAPAAAACRAPATSCTWQISLIPASLTSAPNGAGSPKDKNTAAGR